MKQTTVYLTEDQQHFFEERKNKTGLTVAYQMRDAFNEYIKKYTIRK